MKIMLYTLIALAILDIFYYRFTRVSFDNYRGKAKNLYCKLVAPKDLPTGPVIFVPGIKGSVLEQNGKTVWLRVQEALFGNKQLDYQINDSVKATGILTRIGVIPYLVEYSSYQNISAQLVCSPQSYFFYYDWRGYPDTNSQEFGRLVDRVIKETGKKPSVVAHSMGGLIAHGYIKEHPENINKVVYLSVPFQPGIGYFDDVNDGVPVGLNNSINSKEALFTQPATYLLMPHKGSNRYEGRELMSAETWRDNKFSVFKNSDEDVINLQDFQNKLDRVTEYHKLLDNPKKLDNQFLFIVGKCYSTVLTIDKNGIRHYAPGDGRVSEFSSYPLDILSNKEVEVVCQKHDNQLNDSEILDSIFKFLK